MFADSLLESSWETRSHRGWTTVASFAAQILGLGTLLLLPMFYIEGLPNFRVNTPDILQVPPAAPAPAPQLARHRASSNLNQSGLIVTPTTIPSSIQQLVEPSPPPVPQGAVDTRDVWTPGGTGRGTTGNGVTGSAGDFIAAVAPPPVVHASRPPLSVMMQGNLIDRIQPDYPSIARAARIQGPVILRAIISREGTIENLQVISGHPMLVKAAMDAVKRWRYRPYVLNGQPVEVETQVTVNFVLSSG